MLKNAFFGGSGGGSILVDVMLLLCRVGVGLLLAFGHGLGKLQDHDSTVGFFRAINIPAPEANAWLAAFGEFVGGILLALGLATRPAALMIVITMAVAIVTAHPHGPLFAPKGGGGSMEPALLYLCPALVFAVAGAGRFALDSLLRKGR